MFFSKLSNKLRIDIVLSLKEKPKSVTEICKELKIEQSKLSHALQALKKCNIITCKKSGKNRIYSLNKTVLPILKLIEKHEKTCCKLCCGG